MPRVSVIVAAFNAARFIGSAIASVQAQTERDLEVIVVDDASTDGTAEAVLALAAKDERVRLVRAERNGGPGTARRLGVAAATGEWVAVLDADDRFHPDRLARLLALGNRLGADMVADNLLQCSEGDPARSAVMLPPELISAPRAVTALEFVQGTMGRPGRHRFAYSFLKPMVRREFLRAHGLTYRDIRFAEDFLFALECLLAGANWVVTPEPLYLYTVREGSLTTVIYPPDEVGALLAAYRPLLAGPAAGADPALRDAMERHQTSIELSDGWTRFALALKKRDLSAALRFLTRDRRSFAYISRQGLVALPRAAARLTSRRGAGPGAVRP